MKDLTQIAERKRMIVERYGTFMEKQEKLAPIAARIFSFLLIDNKKGSSFEELVDYLKASKSTVSTNLKSLENTGFVDHFTIPGDRKKYFALSKDGCINRLEETINLYKTELELLNEVIDFKQEENKFIEKEEDKHTDLNASPYLTYISKTIQLAIQLKNALKSKYVDRK